MSMNSTDHKIFRSSRLTVGDESPRTVPLSTPVNWIRTSSNPTVDSVSGIRSSPSQRMRPVRLMETKRVVTKGTVGEVGPEKPVSLPDRFRQSLGSSNKPRSNLSTQRPPIGKSRLGPQESCSSSSSSSSSSSNTSSSSTSTSPTSANCDDSGKGSSTSTKPTLRRSGYSPDLFSFQPINCFCFGTSSRTSASTLRQEICPSSTSTPTSYGRSRSVPPSRSLTSTPQRQPALKVWGNIVPSGKIHTGMHRHEDTNLNVLNPGNKNYGFGTVIMPWCRHRDSDVVMTLTYKFEQTSLSIYNRERCKGYHRNRDPVIAGVRLASSEGPYEIRM